MGGRQRPGESKHGFVLAGMRERGDEDDLPIAIFTEGVFGLLVGLVLGSCLGQC
jgi:hypothetical protein